MKIIAMILAGGKGERLYPLTRDRAKPAVPFGAIYRIIDFSLSNCVNSGIRRIYVLTQYKSLSLNRHIQLGWNILPNKLGEFINVISAQQRIDEHWYRGTADAVFQNIYTLEQERPDLVLILAGDHVYKMDYRKLIQFHLEKKADLTIPVIEMEKGSSREFGVIEADPDYRISGFAEKPVKPKTVPGKPESILASMGIYVFNTELMVRRLIENAKTDSQHDFGKNIVPSMIRSDRVFAFPFEEGSRGRPYWKDVGTIDAYFAANMDLLAPEPAFDLFDRGWPIYTHEESHPPVKIILSDKEVGKSDGIALNSIISGGCEIRGGRVENSLLSPAVRVEMDAEVKNSILLNEVKVSSGAQIRHAIIDKGVEISEGMKIGFNLKEDAKKFTVTESGFVVIPRWIRT
ncbi:MAG TPA: glucose-1-phosphate adenylyltransferase [Thermodesulfobacteriota bacterium]|nr:glucose-1-phosphate adenylyltransferase [Thermodesulfobacteriota bacterium]